MMKNSVFISGCDRSGTTALVRMLNAHPEICIGMERYKGLIGKQESLDTLNHDRFKKNNFFNIKENETNIDWDYFYGPLKDKFDECTYIGDKVPRYFQVFEHLKKEFPNAKHIFLIRDPYEVASSWKVRANDSKDVNWLASNDVERATQVWNNSLISAYKQIKEGNIELVVINYNELFSGDIKQLKKICDHLSISLDEKLLGQFRSMTASWKERQKKELVLDESEFDIVKNGANIKLSTHLFNNF
tara:strand:+ start:8109 stop:8843 length:735 start_codon:yes stop_codon:yes gene_type:complete